MVMAERIMKKKHHFSDAFLFEQGRTAVELSIEPAILPTAVSG